MHQYEEQEQIAIFQLLKDCEWCKLKTALLQK